MNISEISPEAAANLINRGSSNPAYKELLIGCGNRRAKDIGSHLRASWTNLVTLDKDPACDPDVCHDLEALPLPFQDNEFDEIHAYDVLEHVGTQGDYHFFFAQFNEFYRIMKHGALFFATVPKWNEMWAFGDPGHKRVLAPGCFHYLSQTRYEQIGVTKMTDYRNIYKSDFEVLKIEEYGYQINVYLMAMKEQGKNGQDTTLP